MHYKIVEGFQFVHIANAFLSEISLKVTFQGRKIEQPLGYGLTIMSDLIWALGE